MALSHGSLELLIVRVEPPDLLGILSNFSTTSKVYALEPRYFMLMI